MYKEQTQKKYKDIQGEASSCHSSQDLNINFLKDLSTKHYNIVYKAYQ